MGSMVTRHGMHRHAYAAGPGPAVVMLAGYNATVQSRHAGGGLQTLPVAAPVAAFAADGAPFYNSGYLSGYQSVALPGGEVGLALPPRAAMLDLTDRTSWDRPVYWPGVF